MASDGFANMFAAIDAGVSPTILLQGDSTNNDNTDWFYRWLVEKLGPAKPAACIRYTLWDDTSSRYGGWSTLQAGSAGQRYIQFDGVTKCNINPADLVTIASADLEVEIKLSMDDWTPAAQKRVVGILGNAGNRAWYLILNTNGNLQLSWSADGTALNSSNQSSTPPFVDGTAYRIRASLVAATGAISISYSTDDGANWTSILTQTFGATSIFASTAALHIGNVGGSGAYAGKVYEVAVRDGVGGPQRNPLSIESFYSDDTSLTPLGGSPTVYAVNGSQPGAGIASYLDDSTRRPKMAISSPAELVLFSTGHNDVASRDPVTLASVWSTYLSNMRTRLPGADFVGLTQNPRYTGQAAGLSNSDTHRILAMTLGALWQRHDVGVVDTYRAFMRAVAAGGSLSTLVADGVHPSAGSGVDVWVNEVDRVARQRVSY